MKKIKLDKLQLDVMQALWKKGEATVAEVQEFLKTEKDLAITTIGTILSRLEKKNVVAHRVAGRKYIFRALVSEKDTKRSMVSSLINELFQGNSGSLVNHLLEESELDAQDLEKLKVLIEKSEQRKEEDCD